MDECIGRGDVVVLVVCILLCGGGRFGVVYMLIGNISIGSNVVGNLFIGG